MKAWKVEKTNNGVEEIVLLHRPEGPPILVARGGLAWEVNEAMKELLQKVKADNG